MKKDTASGREQKGAGSYEASDVKNLQFPESIRAKPSLYVGALGNDALFHLFKEAAENVIDEALAGHCNFCDIVFGKDGSVTVFDDGRGIPFGKTKIADQLRGGHVEIPTLKAVVSFVHTSGKFTSDSYAVARGCFTGDVQIRLLSGKVVTFKQLYDRWSHDQTPIPVMSFNRKTQKLQPSVISHVQLTMRTRNLVKVFFGDHSVTCTPDHPFFVNRGGSIAKVQAEHLNCGDSLVSTYYSEDRDGYLSQTEQSASYTVDAVSVVTEDTEVPVYDVTVDDTHTFFIEPGVLVSNTHGLGIKCNNALSLSFEAWTRHARNPDKWEYVRYAKGIEKAYKTGKISGMPVNPRTGALPTRGTVVRWLPDSKLLGAEKISLAEVANWLTMAAYFTQGFSLTAFLPNGKSKTFISKNGFHDYLADRLAKLKCETLSPQVFSYQDSLVDCVFQFTNVDSCELQAFTNGLNNPDKGLHFNAVFAALYQALTPFVKKRQEFSIAELREGVVGLVNLKLSAPKFSSQTKDKLVDERAGKPLQDILLKAFEEFFSKHKKLATAVCDRAFDLKALKSQFKASKATLTKLKKSAAAGLPINAATAPHCPPEKRELYIVEGESAAGCFVSGTLIRLADGTVKPIEEITEGTEVLAWHEDDARPAIDRVSAAFNPSDENGVEIRYTTLTKVIFADGTHVVCTPDHLFLTMVGWIPANEMWWEPSVVSATNLGDCPWRRDKILSVDTVTFETPQRVWDLRNLTGYPNFALGNGTVVHNSAKEARDQRFQEILPLRGKVLNVVKQNKGKGDEALTSQQVMNVLNMIGFDPSKKDPLAKLRVGKIIAMSDPDPDGPLVASTRFFAKYESDADWKVVTIGEAFNRRDEQFKVISWAGTVFKTASASFVFEDTVEELVGIKLLGRTFMCTVGHKWPVFKNGELAMVPAGDLKAGVPILRHAFINRQQPLRMAGNTVPAAVAISSVKRHTVAPTWVGCINVPTSHNFMLENGVMTGNCHINTLQMGVYYKYLPQLFERGMIYVVNSPEYYEMVGGEAVTGATPEEVQKKLDKLKAKGRPHHIKGWGEVSPDVLEKLAFDPATRTLLKIEKVTAEQGKKFFELMGTSVEARKALLGIE